MQDIEPNMDELFRKAADNYPLKINDSRWGDIAPKLTHNSKTKRAAKKAGLKKYTGLLLLFVSLVLANGIITSSLKKNTGMQSFQSTTEKKPAISASTNELSNNTSNKKEYTKSAEQHPYPGRSVNNHYNRIIQKAVEQQWENEPLVERSRTDLQQGKILFYRHLPANKINSSYNTVSSTVSQEQLTKIIQSPEKKNSLLMTGQSPAEINIHKKGIWQRKGPYLGAVAGPLFDKVKNQGLKKTGFSMGLVAGYRFNNHLSLETGLLFANKPYFSTGKYFSMDKITNSMPVGMEILSLEGKNNVLEIPVRIKYDFLHKARHHFFSATGISSYIVTYEKNNYLTDMSGVQQSMVSSYKNKSRSAAATFDISAGYEHQIGKSETIRIEPYIQIPLKGMGVGSMPMKSTGIRLGITKFFN